MKASLIPLLLLPFLAPAQDKGIHFEHELSWTAIQAKARAENKYIFVDCYTTWCGPCRFMSTTIFPTEQAGNYFNSKFINVKIQLDTTAKDDAHTKSWYADAHNLMTQYNVRAFPTYLVFTPDGQPLHRTVGSIGDPGMFIQVIGQAFDTSTAFYTQLAQYQAGRRDTAFVMKLAFQCVSVYDLKDGRAIFDTWLATQTHPYSEIGAFQLLDSYTTSPNDKTFAVFTDHAREVDSIMGPGYAQNRIVNLLFSAYYNPAVKAAHGGTPDWKAMQKTISQKYPAYAAEVTAKTKVEHYQSLNDWPHFQTAIIAYMQEYGAHVRPQSLNDYAWTVFQNCRDMTCVADALEWSKRSFADKPVPAFMDTYANILYKMGKKDDALTWEQKAVDNSATNDEKAGYQATIDKMKKGEKTWN